MMKKSLEILSSLALVFTLVFGGIFLKGGEDDGGAVILEEHPDR